MCSDSNHLPVCDCGRPSKAQLVGNHEDVGFYERLLAIEDWKQLHDRINIFTGYLWPISWGWNMGSQCVCKDKVWKAISDHLGCRPGPGEYGGDKLSVSGCILKVGLKDCWQIGYGLLKRRGIVFKVCIWVTATVMIWLMKINCFHSSVCVCIHTHIYTSR